VCDNVATIVTDFSVPVPDFDTEPSADQLSDWVALSRGEDDRVLVDETAGERVLVAV